MGFSILPLTRSVVDASQPNKNITPREFADQFQDGMPFVRSEKGLKYTYAEINPLAKNVIQIQFMEKTTPEQRAAIKAFVQQNAPKLTVQYVGSKGSDTPGDNS